MNMDEETKAGVVVLVLGILMASVIGAIILMPGILFDKSGTDDMETTFYSVSGSCPIDVSNVYVPYNTTCNVVHPSDDGVIHSPGEAYLEIDYESDTPYRIAITWHISESGDPGWDGTYSLLDDEVNDDLSRYTEGRTYTWYVDILCRNTDEDRWELMWTNKDDKWTYYAGEEQPGDPVANASGPYYGEKGNPVTYDASASYDPDGSITEYKWYFPTSTAPWADEDVKYGETVEYTYSTANYENHYYSASLEVTDNDGNKDVDNFRIYISPPPDNIPPVASLSISPKDIEANETITFDASGSYDPDGSIDGYTFIFGDGKTTSGPNDVVTHTYTSGGTYSFTLRVRDNNGTENSTSRDISVASMYTLTVNTEGGGSVSVDPSLSKYPNGTEVTLTANPASGYSFDHWEGDVASASYLASASNNPLTITMDRDRSITACFVEDTTDTYSLSVESNPSNGGTVQKSTDGPYNPGDTVTLTATSEPGYVFTGWSGDASGSSQSTTITMNSDKTIIATFSTDGFDNLMIALLSLAAIGSVGLIAVGLYKRNEYDT